MEVDVEIERAAETQDQGDRTGMSRLAGETGLLHQVGRDATVDDAEHMTHDLGVAGEQEAQRVRNAQPSGEQDLGTERRAPARAP